MDGHPCYRVQDLPVGSLEKHQFCLCERPHFTLVEENGEAVCFVEAQRYKWVEAASVKTKGIEGEEGPS